MPSRSISTLYKLALPIVMAFLLQALPPLGPKWALGDDAGPPIHILAFGDSLTAGYGLARGEDFPARLKDALRAATGRAVSVANAGVSGDTSSGGLARIDWVLASQSVRPDLVIVEFGGNDGLRGIDPEITRRNIRAIVTALQKKGLSVMLTGMQAPPNLGEDYAASFNALFGEIAHETGAAFYPFFLEGVAANSALNQADGIHPNAKGVDIIVGAILPSILETLNLEVAAKEVPAS